MKKAQLSEAALIVFSLIAIAMIMTIYFVLIDFRDIDKSKFELKSATSEIDLELYIQNILATPVLYEGENILARDLLFDLVYQCDQRTSVCSELKIDSTKIFGEMMLEHKIENIGKDKKDCYKSYRLLIDEGTNKLLEVQSKHYAKDECDGTSGVEANYELTTPDGKILKMYLDTSLREP